MPHQNFILTLLSDSALLEASDEGCLWESVNLVGSHDHRLALEETTGSKKGGKDMSFGRSVQCREDIIQDVRVKPAVHSSSKRDTVVSGRIPAVDSPLLLTSREVSNEGGIAVREDRKVDIEVQGNKNRTIPDWLVRIHEGNVGSNRPIQQPRIL